MYEPDVTLSGTLSGGVASSDAECDDGCKMCTPRVSICNVQVYVVLLHMVWTKHTMVSQVMRWPG